MIFLDPNEKIRKQEQNLPHWQQGNAWIFLTWRQGDSLPQSKLLRWKEEKAAWLTHHPKPWDKTTEGKYYQRFGQTMDQWLDAGYGSCLLAKQTSTRIIADALHHFNDQRYHLANYVIMPNHVHVLFQPLDEHRLGDIVRTWKRFTAKEINKFENISGPFWQANYWDRLIRSEEHFKWTEKYIQQNPKNLKPASYVLWSAGLQPASTQAKESSP